MSIDGFLPGGATVVATGLRTMGARPGPLARALELAAEFEDEAQVTLDELLRHIESAPADDGTRLLLHTALLDWDAQNEPEWGSGTRHQTKERRTRIYERLAVPPQVSEAFERFFPPHLVTDPGFEISGTFERWFNEQEQDQAGFYWPKYRQLLRDVEGWPGGNVANLSRASKLVVERLGDPHADDARAHAARGLVVGYVQSGKTANFTGVIARAVDAGYRLIVVLTGMTSILREQTQRRLDKQLIGQELLRGVAAGEFEYEGASDWDEFITYGAKPSDLGRPDWRRLTSFSSDYRRLRQGIGTLHLERADVTQPLNAAVNVRMMPIRLVVAKKNAAPLSALIKDLEQVRKAGFDISRLPTLIIDDESDQASVNTRRPNPADVRRRTAINDRITTLLSLLPRAQYVGYTATPFANVFVDPNDRIGIYPRDFIIGLDRPDGYMGASDFHDFRPPPPRMPSNEKAHVRSVRGDDLAERNLVEALDGYVLSGAIKLFRSAAGTGINTKHHTMLVHTSHKVGEHERLREDVVELISGAGYDSGAAVPRLQKLLAEDFRSVSERLAPTLPFPDSYDDLLSHLEECYTRLQTGPTPVLIVNGMKEYEDETPDFNERQVWKVLVGGTKLSRGYTIENLTVSYYRRPARAADTLMQMGRWFGFRQNYRDLVRLYIGRAEALTRKRTIDLYSAFGAICQDELDFREELHQYALPDDGSDPLRPIDVPPLVTQRFPDVRPTARNRMFNAIQISANFGGKPINPTLAPKDERAMVGNQLAVKKLFRRQEFETRVLGETPGFRALVGVADPDEMLNFLRAYRFSKANLLERQISFLCGDLGDPGIDRWVCVWPQLASRDTDVWTINSHAEVTIIARTRSRESGRFNIYTGSDHVDAARIICGVNEPTADTTGDTLDLRGNRTASGLFYIVADLDEPREGLTVGFALYPPRNSIRGKTRWGVRVPEVPDEPIVGTDGASL